MQIAPTTVRHFLIHLTAVAKEILIGDSEGPFTQVLEASNSYSNAELVHDHRLKPEQ